MNIQNKSSVTALGTAFFRALSCYENDDKIKGHDDLAKLFLSTEIREKLNDKAYRYITSQSIKKTTYAYIIARTDYFDELFASALKNHIPQIVNLGTGYDSRAYRYKCLMNSTKIFEVDSSSTQIKKIHILNQNIIDHSHVTFVPIDFERDDLEQMLLKSGFDKRQKSLFILEGVTPYLTFEAFCSMLNSIKSISHHEDILAFDYINCKPNKKLILNEGEIIQFGMIKEEMTSFINNQGFSVLENLVPFEIESRYLFCSNGELFSKTDGTMNLLMLRFSF